MTNKGLSYLIIGLKFEQNKDAVTLWNHFSLKRFKEFKESNREADFMLPKTSQCRSDLEISNFQ